MGLVATQGVSENPKEADMKLFQGLLAGLATALFVACLDCGQ